jgi:hypothetical protein
MKSTQRFFSVTVGLLVLATPILAHHGTNISYDHAKPATLQGTVTEFVWRNPHCQLYFDVKDASGKITGWAGELNSPSVLGREGWTKRQFKAGDKITITVFPSKAGAFVGVVDRTRPIFVDGKEAVKANARNVD